METKLFTFPFLIRQRCFLLDYQVFFILFCIVFVYFILYYLWCNLAGSSHNQMRVAVATCWRWIRVPQALTTTCTPWLDRRKVSFFFSIHALCSIHSFFALCLLVCVCDFQFCFKLRKTKQNVSILFPCVVAVVHCGLLCSCCCVCCCIICSVTFAFVFVSFIF